MKVEMFLILILFFFIAKWGRNIRWAPSNTAIKNREEHLHSIGISLTRRETETMWSPGWFPKIGLKFFLWRWLPQRASQANNPQRVCHDGNKGKIILARWGMFSDQHKKNVKKKKKRCMSIYFLFNLLAIFFCHNISKFIAHLS